MKRSTIVGVFCSICVLIGNSVWAQRSVIVNGTFAEWIDNQPSHWQIDIGASNGGQSPTSTVGKGLGPSLELSGNGRTLAWKLVRQSVAVIPGETLRLTFRAKATGLKREGRQYNNCHVGLWAKDVNEKNVGHFIQNVAGEEYLDYSVIARMPANATTVDVSIFLSKTGTLNVATVKLEKFDDGDSFDLVASDLTAKYSYFDLKKINFAALVKKYRPLANAATTRLAFADVVANMFAEFNDMHTFVIADDKRINKTVSSFKPNYNFRFVDADLRDVRRFGPVGLVGTTSTGLGYVRVAALSGVTNDQIKQFIKAIKERFDLPAFIVDLRRNSGGAEGIAQAIAAQFADKQNVYARQKFRSQNGLTETPPRTIQPGYGQTFASPIVCLSGPGAVSSAEGFVLMMKALDHCTVVGQPTRGASGNPQPVPLPNGVDVWFSRWQSLTPDGSPIEGVGVLPDIQVKFDASADSDNTYEAALKMLLKH